MSTNAPAVSKSPSISRRFIPLSMTCVSPLLRGLPGRTGTPRNPSAKPGIGGTIPNHSHSDHLFGAPERLVDVAQELLDLVRARGLRIGVVPASRSRVGCEPREGGLPHAQPTQPRPPRARGQRPHAA